MGTNTHETRFLLTARDSTRVALGAVNTNLTKIGRAVSSVHVKIAGLVGVGGFGALTANVISTNREFQNLNASLITVTGSTQGAENAFKTIEKFATETPFQLTEVVDAFTRLKSMGLDPSERALRSYGNTSSAMGKGLNQMIEAVADAATGEFERLKEFGIRARKEKDRVTFTFQGISQTVKNNSESIQEYLLAIGENQFASGMANQMNTIGGAFSNLEDATGKLKRMIGNAGINELVIDTTRGITEMINALEPKQVEDFVMSALYGFEDILLGVDAAYKYIDGNRYLQASGVVGYMLFGKWGVAGALALSGLTDKLGKDIGKAWEEWNPSGIVEGSGGFGGKTGYNPMPQYRLGDFNNGVGGRGSDFDEWVDRIRNNPQIDESNSFLSSIADQLGRRADMIYAKRYDAEHGLMSNEERKNKTLERLREEDAAAEKEMLARNEVEKRRKAALLIKKNAAAEALMKKGLGIDDFYENLIKKANAVAADVYGMPKKTKGSLDKLIIGPSDGQNRVVIDDSKQINRTNELLIEIKETLKNQNNFAVAG